MDLWPKIHLFHDSIEACCVAFMEACNAFNVTYIDTRSAQRKRRRYFEEITREAEDLRPALKRRDTPESREFWADADRASQEVESWPAWKRGRTHDVFENTDD